MQWFLAVTLLCLGAIDFFAKSAAKPTASLPKVRYVSFPVPRLANAANSRRNNGRYHGGNGVGASNARPSSYPRGTPTVGRSRVPSLVDDGQPPRNPGSHVYNTVDDPKWRQIPPPAGWNPERKRSGERLSGSPRSPHNDARNVDASNSKPSLSSPKGRSEDKNTPVPKPGGDREPTKPKPSNNGDNVSPSIVKPALSSKKRTNPASSSIKESVDDSKPSKNIPSGNGRNGQADVKPTSLNPNGKAEHPPSSFTRRDDAKNLAKTNDDGNQALASDAKSSSSSPKVGSDDKNTPVPKPGGDANAQTPRPGSQGSRKIPASILKPSPSPDEQGRVRTPPVKPLVDGTATPKEKLSNSDETKLGSSNLKTAPSSPKGKVRFATDPIETSEDDEKPSTEKPVDDEDAEAKVETTSPSPKETRKFASSHIRKPVDGRPPTGKTSIPGKQVPGSGTNMSAGYPREMFDFEFIPMGNLHDKGDKYSQPHDERRFQIFDVRKLIEDDNKLPHKTMKVGENTPTTFNLPSPSLNGNKDRGILPVIPLTDANIPLTPGQEKPSTHYILVPKVEDNAQQATSMVHNNHAPKLSDAATQTSPSLPKENGKIIPIDIKSFIEDTKAATAMMARYSAPKVAEIATQTNISHLDEKEKTSPSLVVPSVDDTKPTTLNTDGNDKADTLDTKPSPLSERSGEEMKRFSAQPLDDGLESDLRSPSFEGNEENVDSFHLRKDANDNKPVKEKSNDGGDSIVVSDSQQSPSSKDVPKSESSTIQKTVDEKKPTKDVPSRDGKDTKTNAKPSSPPSKVKGKTESSNSSQIATDGNASLSMPQQLRHFALNRPRRNGDTNAAPPAAK